MSDVVFLTIDGKCDWKPFTIPRRVSQGTSMLLCYDKKLTYSEFFLIKCYDIGHWIVMTKVAVVLMQNQTTWYYCVMGLCGICLCYYISATDSKFWKALTPCVTQFLKCLVAKNCSTDSWQYCCCFIWNMIVPLSNFQVSCRRPPWARAGTQISLAFILYFK